MTSVAQDELTVRAEKPVLLAVAARVRCGSVRWSFPLRLLIVATLLIVPVTLQAADSAVRIESVVVGTNGFVKVGQWTPISVAVESTMSGPVSIEVGAVDPDGNPTWHESEKFEISPGRRLLSSLFMTGRLDSNLSVHVRGAEGRLASMRLKSGASEQATFEPPLRQSAVLVAVLNDPSATDAISAELAGFSGAPLVVAPVAASDFSRDPLGLESIDVLLVSGFHELSTEAMSAVRRWVQDGGHLVLCIGSDAERYLSSPWAEWVPVSVVGSARLRELSGVERYAGKSKRIAVAGGVRSVRIAPGDSDVRITGLDGPLLVRAPYGFGRVTFLGLDVERPPLSRWESLPELLRRLVDRKDEASGSQSTPKGGQIARTGLSDLATQLRSAQESFETVHRFSIWMVMGLIAGYVLLAGPLDYLIVHRLLKRPQLTWITFPSLAALVTFAAITMANRSNGDNVQISQIDVVDIDELSGAVRGRSSLSLYSPATQRLLAESKPLTQNWSRRPLADSASRAESVALAWDGLPEESFGGMYREGGGGIARPAYTIAPRGKAIENLPLAVWSTKALAAEWEHSSAGLVDSRLTSPVVGQLSGSLTHRLPGPLRDWALAYGNRVYLPREHSDGRPNIIPPGAAWTPLRGDVFQRELLGFLTGTIAMRVKNKISGLSDDIQVEQTEWNALHRDPVDVLRMITFHEKSDGARYTGLTNDTLRKRELSPLLELNRAILFGRIETPASQLTISNAAGAPAEPVKGTRTMTFVRLVLPVTRAGAAPAVLPDFSEDGSGRPKSKIMFPSPSENAPAEAEIPETSPTEPNTP